MRSTLTYGSVRGAAREGRSYRDHELPRDQFTANQLNKRVPVPDLILPDLITATSRCKVSSRQLQ